MDVEEEPICGLCFHGAKCYGELLSGYYLAELRDGRWIIATGNGHKDDIIYEFSSRPAPEPTDNLDSNEEVAWDIWYKGMKNPPFIHKDITTIYLFAQACIAVGWDTSPRFDMFLYDYAGKFLIEKETICDSKTI